MSHCTLVKKQVLKINFKKHVNVLPVCGVASIWVWFQSEAAPCQSPR